MVDRTHRELTQDDIEKVAGTYHAWRGTTPFPRPRAGEGKGEGAYADVAGFCKSVTLDEIRGHGHILTPGRYVGAEKVEDDGEPFEQKMARLTKQLDEQFKESARLEKEMRKNLRGLVLGR
jgi:type I restriction enzyme M protein